MKKYMLFFIFASLLSMSIHAQQTPSADAVLLEARAKATKENKKLMVIFHASWCGWCHKMDTSLNDPSVKPFFDKNFVITHLTISESENKKLLDVTPFWMLDAKYFLTTGVALLATLLFREKLFRWSNTLFLFDAIGLGLFTIVGISKSLAAGLPFWVCIVMGTITGSVGGVARDVLLNEVPLLFRKDIYALACVAGGVVYFVCHRINLPIGLTELIAALTVIAIRVLAVKFHIHLPLLHPIVPKDDSKGKT